MVIKPASGQVCSMLVHWHFAKEEYVPSNMCPWTMYLCKMSMNILTLFNDRHLGRCVNEDSGNDFVQWQTLVQLNTEELQTNLPDSHSSISRQTYRSGPILAWIRIVLVPEVIYTWETQSIKANQRSQFYTLQLVHIQLPIKLCLHLCWWPVFQVIFFLFTML